MSFAEETLSNTFDFAHRLTHVKELQELPQIQNEFISRQASYWETKPKNSEKVLCRGRKTQPRPRER